MKNSDEMIEVPLIFICSKGFKWTDRGIRFAPNYSSIPFPEKCGDKFNDVRVIKDIPTKVEVRRVGQIGFIPSIGGDNEIELKAFSFEEGVTYDLQIVSDDSGKKVIEIQVHDPETISKNHNHEES